MDIFNSNNPLQPVDKLTAFEPLTSVDSGLNLNLMLSATAITPLAPLAFVPTTIGATAAPTYPPSPLATALAQSLSTSATQRTTDLAFTGMSVAPNWLQTDSIAPTPNYAIKAGGIVTFTR